MYLFEANVLCVGVSASCHEDHFQPFNNLFLVAVLDMQRQAAVILLLYLGRGAL